MMKIEWQSKSLEQKLAALKDKKVQSIMSHALHEGGEVFRAAVVEAAPERVDDLPSGTALPPGALKSDVILHKDHDTKQLAYDVEFGRETAHVARWVDEGHRLVLGGYSHEVKGQPGTYRGPGKEVGSVPPHPFFREAFETAAANAEKVIEESITTQVNRAWKSAK